MPACSVSSQAARSAAGEDVGAAHAEGARGAMVTEVDHDIRGGQAVEVGGAPGLEGGLEVGAGAIRIDIIRDPVAVQVQVRIRGEIVDGVLGEPLVVQGAIGEVRGGLGIVPEGVARIRPAPGHDNGLGVLRQRDGVELLDSVVESFRNIDIAGSVDHKTAGAVELAIAACPWNPTSEGTSRSNRISGCNFFAGLRRRCGQKDLPRRPIGHRTGRRRCPRCPI